MKSEIHMVRKVKFTQQERDAMRIIGSIRCGDTPCSICPLSHGELCFRNEFRNISEALEVLNE